MQCAFNDGPSNSKDMFKQTRCSTLNALERRVRTVAIGATKITQP